MSLSADLISQFVKATKDDKKTKSETTVYGTVVEYAGSNYVKFDGSDLLTPVETTVDAEPGDRVTVLLKDHTATVTGNVSSPAARTAAVQLVVNNVTELETVLADFISVDELAVESARIDSLDAENANIKQKLTAYDADITHLEAEVARIDELVVTDADITQLQADVVNVKETLTAHNSSIETLEAEVANIDDLIVNNIEGKYANIDFSNISKATMGEFYANSGLIQNVVVGDATITGNLVGVTISGDLIETNTLVADKLVIQGEDGLYYALNTDGVSIEAEQTDYNSLDGSVIRAQSITATKIDVDDLVAFGATIGGFKITENSLYSGVKETVDNTTRGVYLDNDGQVAFGDTSRYVKYYQDTDDTYKLDLCADAIKFAATGTDLASGVYGIVSGPSTIEMREDIDNLEVRVTDAEASITLLSDSITSNVTETTNLGTRMTTVEQTASGLTTRIEDVRTAANDAAKTATNFMNLSGDGLVVGDLTDEILGKNVLLGSDAVKVRTGTTENAVFGGDIIELAKNNESATISMLNDKFKIYYDADSSDGGFGVYGKMPDGRERLAFQPVNEIGNLTLGWGGYEAGENKTNLYGNEINIFSKTGVIIYPGEGQYIEASGNVFLPNGRNIFSNNANGVKRSVLLMNNSNQLFYGYGSYSNSEGDVYYDGNTVNIRSKTSVKINGREYGQNQILWSGGMYMTGGHTANLSANISDQPNGIVIIFSRYASGAAQNYQFSSHFVPKSQVTSHDGGGHSFLIASDPIFSVVASKYLYIYNTKITGHADNSATGTGESGIKYTNNAFVMRYVIGV